MQVHPDHHSRLQITHVESNRQSSELSLKLETVYNQVCEQHRYYIEWRYKLISKMLTVWTFLTAACAWLWTHDLQSLTFLPCLIAAFLSVTGWQMERRTVVHIQDIEEEGAKLEKQARFPGPFVRLLSNQGKPFNYDVLMPRVYFYGAVIWFVIMILCFYMSGSLAVISTKR